MNPEHISTNDLERHLLGKIDLPERSVIQCHAMWCWTAWIAYMLVSASSIWFGPGPFVERTMVRWLDLVAPDVLFFVNVTFHDEPSVASSLPPLGSGFLCA